jgi:hypothetical protein
MKPEIVYISFMSRRRFFFSMIITLLVVMPGGVRASGTLDDTTPVFPRSLENYHDEELQSVPEILIHRIREEPFNLVATLIFFCAIVHTFMAGRLMAVAHRWQHKHEERIRRREVAENSVHPGAELFHFLGEVEVVFGLWAVVLIATILGFHGWDTVVHYVGHDVNFNEACFVVVIMVLSTTRPILKFAEAFMLKIAGLLGGSLIAFWVTVMTLGPILGSFITEPASMTISALLLSRCFYDLEPSLKLKYATLGLLFVNISVGGTLTHFAAPPVLMVAEPWGWGMSHMLSHFGWKTIVGMLAVNSLYLIFFRSEFKRLQEAYALRLARTEIEKRFVTRKRIEEELITTARSVSEETGADKSLEKTVEEVIEATRARMEEETLPRLGVEGVDPGLIHEAFVKRFEEIRLLRMRRMLPLLVPEEQRPEFLDPDWDKREDPVPFWVTAVHLCFMVWTIMNAHYPALFVLGLLFFLGFARITADFQNRIDLKPAMLVGFFLAGLVIHGGVQAWWIAPVLGNLKQIPLMLGSTILTAFNDNAAITYLSTLVPGFTDALKYAVVAGAVAGGGLTVIANAPNPAGQSILKSHFGGSVSPAGLFKAALIPTCVYFLCFLIL